MAIEPVSAQLIETRLAGIIWGDAKTGKTTWAMSLPGKKLLVNFDPDGYLSVAHRDDLDILDLSALQPTDMIEEAKKAAAHIAASGDKYQSVIVDSVTSLVSASLQSAIAKGIGKSAIFTPSLDAPGLVAYGARNNHTIDVVQKLLRATSRNKQHCFFIAHSDDPEYDSKGENIVNHTMMLSAKVRQTAGLSVSEIYHIALASGNRRTVYLAPFGVKAPMGSRIFDTKAVPRFDLNYDIYKDDAEQPCALSNIFEEFRRTRQKLTVAPK